MKDKTYRMALRARKDNYFWKEDNFCFTEVHSGSERYWQADPFLFDYDGKTFLFYEQFDRIKRRGMIAYSIVDDEKHISKPRIIIKEKFHLSFPYVFEQDGQIWIMPETCEDRKIYLYRAVDFPNTWEKQVLVDSFYSCDSIWLFKDHTKFALIASELMEPPKPGTLQSCYVRNIRYDLSGAGLDILRERKELAEGDYGIRNAGACFYDDNVQIRPGQDCTENRYGNGIVLFRVDSLDPYSETSFFAFTKDDLPGHLNRFGNQPLLGTHTYNISSKYEVIDFSFMEELSRWVAIGKQISWFIGKVKGKLKYLWKKFRHKMQ